MHYGKRAGNGKRGFKRAATLLSKDMRRVGESRGFAVSRVLTHWEEIVGADIARMARPVEVSYARKGFGATLTLLVGGAVAPMIEMQKAKILEKVNACYGHAAIARIRLTQTAAAGFAEPQAPFTPAPNPVRESAIRQEVATLSQGVTDEGLKTALETLGRNVLTRAQR